MPRRFLALSAALLLSSAALTGCDEGVDPTLGTEQAFTLYGYLNPDADTQAVRVVPIADRLDPENPALIDATVTSQQLPGGPEVTWRDSVVTFEDGTVGHVFTAAFTPLPSTRYRIAAARSDGDASTVEVTTPPLVRPVVEDPVATATDVIYPVFFPEAPRVNATRLVLYLAGTPEAPDDTVAVAVPYPDEAEPAADGWRVPVAFVSTVRPFLEDEGLLGVSLVEAELEGFVANAEWEVPEGGFDPDVIVEPGVLGNVENGFGFVGAGYVAGARWTPSQTVQARAGFAVPGEPAVGMRVNEVLPAAGWVELYNPTAAPIDVSGYYLSDAAGDPASGLQIPSGTVVPSEGFASFDVSFPLVPGGSVVLANPNGRTVVHQLDLVVAQPERAGGLYPDGRTQPARGYDPFNGPLASTRGAPNRPLFRPYLLNEVHAPAGGFVELYGQDPGGGAIFLDRVDLWDGAAEDVFFDSLGVEPGALPAYDAAALPFALRQTGGDLFLKATFVVEDRSVTPVGGGPWSVYVDHRAYGVQSPAESEGRLPDGGDWESGLAPTRAAPNRQ